MRWSLFFWESAVRWSLSRGSAPRSGSTPESLLRRRHGAFPGAMANTRPEPSPEPSPERGWPDTPPGRAGGGPGAAGAGDERTLETPGTVRREGRA